MPSSISSSNERLPTGPWGRTWMMTAALTVFICIGWEFWLRGKGYETSHADTPKFWALTRSKMHENDRNAIVVIGESRAQFGLDSEVLERDLKASQVIQLAVKGSSAHPVFKHLALETTFSGTVIYSVNESFFFDRRRGMELVQSEMTGEYTKFRVLDRCEYSLRSIAQEYLVSQNETYSVENMLKQVPKNGWPAPDWRQIQSDRSALAHFNLNQRLEKLKQQQRDIYERLNFTPTPEELTKLLTELETYVKLIQARGGRVVFVRMPSKGEIWGFEDKYYPRKNCWDVLAARTSAICIHFDDNPAMGKLMCPDESHLDAKDRVEFTQLLVENIQRKQSTP